MTAKWTFPLSLSIGIAAIVLYHTHIISLLAPLTGQVLVDSTRIVRWAASGPLNNGNCQRFDVADACEDVKIHQSSHTAFLACGNPEERAKWYPCAGRSNAKGRTESTFQEYLFKHDLKMGQTTKLKIEGLDGDFITHGIDIFELSGEPKKIHIFAVNHARESDSISIFSHVLGTEVVSLVVDVKHEGIKTANGVAAIGPLEFYITNDHYYRTGFGRMLEEIFGPWGWATHVQHCWVDQKFNEGGSLLYRSKSCKQVTGTFPGANGLAKVNDKLFVGDARNGTVTIFQILPDETLKMTKQIDLGAAADNIKVISGTEDVTVAIFPTLEDLPLYLDNTRRLGRDLLVPTGALRLLQKNDYQPELIYRDNGSVLSFMTAAAVDPELDLLVGGAVLQYGGFAVCKLAVGALKG